MAPPILQARFRIGGMDCASCAAKIDTAIRRIDAVEDVAVSVTAGTMTVKHRQSADMKAIEKRVSGLGYTIVPIPGTDRHSSSTIQEA
ncbi:heavy-metal-associated domain-containing protein, partial [Ciceribacter sp. T2.26MG-112.2]|uniref:heavy-metal-associated domain-containing protein n=3 Tax=Rhizobiaceae TaxID=82115 RepID=UPI0012B69BD9